METVQASTSSSDDNRRPVSAAPSARAANDNDWLSAYYDPVAGIFSHTNAIELSDIFADGDNKLVAANYGQNKNDLKLKVFKGASLIKESNLIDTPTAVLSFYMDNLQPRVPAIAVASGSALYVYKNLRPGFQFTLPPLDVSDIERDIWAKAKEESIDIMTMQSTLEDIRRAGQISLSVRSLMFLSLPPDDMRRYVDTFKNIDLKKQAVITCLSKMNKNSSDDDALNCLVVGTEHKTIYVLDAEAFTILATMECPHIPAFLNVSGLFDVEYRIIAGCRDGMIYNFKRGSKTPKASIPLSSQIVGLEKSGKNIIVGCMDNGLYCYTTKGKRLWKIEMPSFILTMSSMEIKSKGIQAVVVALNNKQVHIYRDKYLISKLDVEDPVVGIKFGRFGREEGNLLMTTRNGGLLIKILKRNATLQDKDPHAGPPEAQSKKLDIPKKTKLYVDQTTRERENAAAMHQTFQQELYKFRIKTARAFLKSLQTSSTPVSTNPNEPLRLNAQVQGIGPTFKLIIKVQNISASTSSVNLYITFMYDENLYKIAKNYIELPMLVPALEYPFSTYVQTVTDQMISDNIKVLLCKKNCNIPIITAVISMPVSETEIIA